MSPEVLQMLQALQGKMSSEGNLGGGPQLPPTDMGMSPPNQFMDNGSINPAAVAQMQAAGAGGAPPPGSMMGALMTPPPSGAPPMAPPPAPMY